MFKIDSFHTYGVLRFGFEVRFLRFSFEVRFVRFGFEVQF